MEANQEHAAFSRRLRQALDGAGLRLIGPTLLARKFAEHYPNQRITVHAARKWLLGESIPTQERVQALARWLMVSPQWLRYGEATDTTPDVPGSCLTLRDSAALAQTAPRSQFMAELDQLSPQQFLLIRDLVRELLRSTAQP